LLRLGRPGARVTFPRKGDEDLVDGIRGHAGQTSGGRAKKNPPNATAVLLIIGLSVKTRRASYYRRGPNVGVGLEDVVPPDGVADLPSECGADDG
jgi:hypothetical protein